MSIQKVNEELNKYKSSSAKETKSVNQQTEENDRINEEIRNVSNLTAFEEAKLTRAQVDE